MTSTSMTKPLVTWKNNASNPLSWNQENLVVIKPMTMEPVQNLSLITIFQGVLDAEVWDQKCFTLQHKLNICNMTPETSPGSV